AQEPKVQSYFPKMKRGIAEYLGITDGQINIKATTTEHLGFTGRKEGIAAMAVVLIEGTSK
ncbi:MAG: 2-C-methyl-D-erythritol 2,4-cyclodiphosphate synthase, partial [Candidatus Margulisiibacteriota bacterium]